MSDAMTKEEQAQFEEMRRADAEYEAQAPQEPPPPPRPPPPAPEPAVPEPPVADEPPAPEPDAVGRVDKRALDEARIAARQLREQLQREQTQHAEAMARLDERFRLLQGAVEQHAAQQQPPPPPAPDFNTDPYGYIQNLKTQLGQLQERVAQSEQQRHQQQEVNDLQAWGFAQEQQFAQQQPDYTQATAYLHDKRRGLLRAMGEQDENRINQQVLMDVAGLALHARAHGLNFGKMLYDVAVQHGYQPGQAAARPGNGAAQTPSVSLSAAERLARGTDMATTLGATGGAARGEPAAAHIAAMSEEEFNRYYAEVQKQGGAALRNLLGA